MILLWFLIQPVRNTCGILLHMVPVRLASKTGPITIGLIIFGFFPLKMAKTRSQYLNDTQKEIVESMERNVTYYLEKRARIDCSSIFILKFAIDLLCNCDKIT